MCRASEDLVRRKPERVRPIREPSAIGKGPLLYPTSPGPVRSVLRHRSRGFHDRVLRLLPPDLSVARWDASKGAAAPNPLCEVAPDLSRAGWRLGWLPDLQAPPLEQRRYGRQREHQQGELANLDSQLRIREGDLRAA